MMKLQFFAGEGREFGSVNYVIGKSPEIDIYGEIEVHEGASEDYGFLAIKGAILMALEKMGKEPELSWPYEGQEDCLAADASVDAPVYVDIDDGDDYINEII